MSKVITFSRKFPGYHPNKGQPTYFVEQVLNALEIDYRGTKYFTLLVELNPKLDISILSKFHQSLPRGRTNSKKLHTIRNGHRFQAGEKASFRVWSGVPYNSPQIIFAPDQEIKQVGDFQIQWNNMILRRNPEIKHENPGWVFDPSNPIVEVIAKNDGLSTQDLLDWFQYPKPFDGQIIAWKEVPYS